MSIIEKAKIIATEAHKGVFRKWSENTPYIVHPERVANKVASLKNIQPEDIAAAWCHDVVEDTEDPIEKDMYARRIERECGAVTLTLVMELTFPTEGADWKDKPRVEKNVIRFAQMRGMTPRAQRIKMVDRWDNLQDMVNAPHRLKRKTIDESWELHSICKDADLDMAKELEDMIRKLSKT
jgi:(p)ppGpp synthase/HD superfamily hydrolase